MHQEGDGMKEVELFFRSISYQFAQSRNVVRNKIFPMQQDLFLDKG